MRGRENEQPLEARMEQRANSLGSSIKETANDLKSEGLREGALAEFYSMHDHINDLIGRSALRNTGDKEKFIEAVYQAMRTLSHGLTMGDQGDRYTEQLNIANGGSLFARQVSEALRKANGTGKSGGQETMMRSEHEV